MGSLKRHLAALAVLVLASAAWAGEHGSYLGVDVDDVTKERVQALKLRSETGVEVTMVDSDAPAGKAGLKEHDVILQFNGQAVDSVEQLRRMIRETPPGRTVQLTISRDGNQQTVPVTLADRAKVYSWTPMPAVPRVPMPPRIRVEVPEVYVMTSAANVGLQVESLTPQLGEFFGVKNGDGLLVRSVEKGSAAENAGFRAGDVIVKVEQEPVTDRGDWRSALRRKSGKVPVSIIRDKREQTLTLVLPERKQSSRGRVLVGPDSEDFDFDLDLDEIAAVLPEAMDVGMLKAKVELERSKGELKKELERTRKHMKQQRRELEKQQKELRKRIEIEVPDGTE